MAYANPSTFVAGNTLTAAQQNVLAANDRFFHGPPLAIVVRETTAQSVNTGVWTALSFQTEVHDSNSMWSSTASNKLFCRTAGKYLVTATANFASSTGGTARWMAIMSNTTSGGADVDADGKDGGAHYHTFDQLSGAQFISHSAVVAATTSDYICIGVFHNAGVALNMTNCQASMLWVSS